MRTFQFTFIAFIILAMLSSCVQTIPIMKLDHKAALDSEPQQHVGMLQPIKIQDARPAEEKISGQQRKPGWQVWSGKTEPETMSYVKNIVERECTTCGMFEIDASGEYQLKTQINSLKVIGRQGTLQTVAGWVAVGAVATVYISPITALLIDGVAIGLTMGSFNPLVAQMDVEAELLRNGETVWTGNIRQRIKSSNWSSSPESMSAKGSQILDHLVTKTAHKLLTKIAAETKLGLFNPEFAPVYF